MAMIRKLTLSGVCLLLMGVCLAGCRIPLDGNGTIGVEVSTRWVLIHETEKNDPEFNSEAELDLKPLMDLFLTWKKSGEVTTDVSE